MQRHHRRVRVDEPMSLVHVENGVLGRGVSTIRLEHDVHRRESCARVIDGPRTEAQHRNTVQTRTATQGQTGAAGTAIPALRTGDAGVGQGLGARAGAQVTTQTPSVQTPSVQTPNTPAVALPAVTVPVINSPAVNVPSVNTPSINVPAVTTPQVNIPAVATPSVNVPTVTTPSVNVPVVQTPTVNVPVVNSPAINIPNVMRPQM